MRVLTNPTSNGTTLRHGWPVGVLCPNGGSSAVAGISLALPLGIPPMPLETLARSNGPLEGVASCASSQLGKRPRHCGYFARGIICFDFLLLAIYLILLRKTNHIYLGNLNPSPSGKLIHVIGGGSQVQSDSQRSIYRYILAAHLHAPSHRVCLTSSSHLDRLLVNAGLAAYARWLSKCQIFPLLSLPHPMEARLLRSQTYTKRFKGSKSSLQQSSCIFSSSISTSISK
jgi:hypothetical protein